MATVTVRGNDLSNVEARLGFRVRGPLIPNNGESNLKKMDNEMEEGYNTEIHYACGT